LLFANFFRFQYSFCYRNISQDVAMLVWSERTTPYNYCCCLLVFSDCGILFVTVIIYGSSYLTKFATLYCHSNTSQDVARLVWSERTTIIAIYCCLLFFSDSSIIFVTLIIYGSSYLPKFATLYCHSNTSQDIARYRMVGVIRKNNAMQLLMLFANFF
jgi:hypothetical protein